MITLRYTKKTVTAMHILIITVLFFSMCFTTNGNALVPGSSVPNSPKAMTDAYGRDTPNGTMKGILDAIQKKDAVRLTYYLPKSFVVTKLSDADAQQVLLQQLNLLFNKHSYLMALHTISKEPQGLLDDTLVDDKEKIGEMTYVSLTPAEKDIYLQQIKQDNKTVWVLPTDFLERLPVLSTLSERSWLDTNLPAELQENIWGYTIGHILLSLILLVTSLIIGYFLALFLLLLKHVTYKWHRQVWSFKEVYIPMTFILGTFTYQYVLKLMEIERQTQVLFLPIIQTFNILAISWLVYRIVSIITNQLIQKALQTKHNIQVSFVYLCNGLVKFLIFIFTGLFVLENLNIDVTSGFALLGLGGLALALGTQKTIENLVGSVVLVADKPIDIGDMCRFGDTMGKVENIGIRSTRIRTFDRTIVTIPNGLFSSIQIENLSQRDMFLFQHTFAFGLLSQTTIIEKLLQDMQHLLADDVLVSDTDYRVRLRYIERDCFKIEVFCYILVTESNLFYTKQESLLLALLSIINKSEVNLAMPVSVISTSTE